jgi:hypothetical protein
MNIIEVLVPLFAFIILYPVFREIYRFLGFEKAIEGLMNKKGGPFSRDEKTTPPPAAEKPTPPPAAPDKSVDKSIVEDTTKAKIISQQNDDRLNKIEKTIAKFGSDNEQRFVTVESQLENISAQNDGQDEIKDSIDILKTKVESNKINLADMKQTINGAPTVDYVNSKVSSIESEMTDMQRNFKEMRKEYQSYKNE